MVVMKTIAKACAIYTRKSTDEGLDTEFNTLDAQREACEAYITSQRAEGWQTVKTRYDDGGYSGGTLDRPALQKLLHDIKDSKVDIVVVYKIDRLTRALMDFAKLVDIFDAHDVTFVSVTQSFNTTTSMGRLTLNVLLSFAQFEREVAAERIRDKIAASKKKGMWMGGVPPVGYKVEKRQLLINQDEAQTEKLIFDLYLHLGNVRDLKYELDRKHIKSPARLSQRGNQYGGNLFSRGALYSILKNPAYIGQIRHKDKIYDGNHDALIDENIWQAVQKKLQAKSNERTKRTRRRHVLQGLLFDPDDTLYTPSFTKRHGREYRYYISQNLLQYRDHPRGVIARLPAQEIEDLIEQNLRDNLTLLCNDDEISNYVEQHHHKLPESDLIRACITKITVARTSITLHVCGGKVWRTLLENHLKVSVPESNKVHQIEVPYKTGRTKSGAVVLKPVTSEDPLDLPPYELKKLVQGIIWRDAHFDGESLRGIARREGCSDRYVGNCIMSAFDTLMQI